MCVKRVVEAARSYTDQTLNVVSCSTKVATSSTVAQLNFLLKHFKQVLWASSNKDRREAGPNHQLITRISGDDQGSCTYSSPSKEGRGHRLHHHHLLPLLPLPVFF